MGLKLRPGDQGALAVIPELFLVIALPRSPVIIAAMDLLDMIPMGMIVVIVRSLVAIRISAAPLLTLRPLHFLNIL